MKKFALIIMSALLLSVSLFGCTTTPEEQIDVQIDVQGEMLNIVATIFAPFDFAREIAGTRANVTMLLAPGQDSHAFQPSPRDMITIMNSDVFMHIGGDMDLWVYRILDAVDAPDMRVITLMDAVELVEKEIVEGMEHDHDHSHGHHHHHGHSHDHEHDEDDHEHHHHHEHEDEDHEHHHHDHDDEEHGHHHHHDHDDEDHEHLHHHDHDDEDHEHHHHHDHDDEDHHHDHEHHHHEHYTPMFDEHVWTSPRNVMLIVQEITRVLSELDPDNAYYYEANLAAYLLQLEELDAAFQDVVDNAVRNTIAFGDKFPFRYFVDAYGLDYYAAFPGCSTDTEPSAATVTFLINRVNELELPVIFHVELSNRRLAYTISSETGARVLELHSAHNITRDDYLAGISYIDIMTANVSALREALH
ncbi:MAG: metal ABC transporter substrate-binding protein [Defluviitaleaceae bacterium]|nr:metal ABC transporter substrate-binding protein [Defluviitaleaceae bacterium]